MKILNSDIVAIKDEARDITYKQLISNIIYSSQKMNISKNDRVILLTENRCEWIYFFYSIWSKSGIVIPLNPEMEKKELDVIIKNIEPILIICSNKTKDLFDTINFINIDDLDFNLHHLTDDDFELIINDKIAIIYYTYNSEDKLIGVELSKENLFFGLEEFKKNITNETFYSYLPFYNSISLQFMVIKALFTSSTIFIDNSSIPSEILKNINKNEVTLFIGTPIFYRYLYKKLKILNSRNFINKSIFNIFKYTKLFKNKIINKKTKFLFSIGSHLDYNIQQYLEFSGLNILPCYGFAESGSLVSISLPNNNKIGTVGKILEGIEVKEFRGEILIKGKNIAKGYFNNLEVNSRFSDEWFHTGEIGHIDNDFLYIYGRKSDLITLSNGQTVWPNEIENQINNLSSVIKEVSIIDYRGKLTAVIVPDLEESIQLKINNIEYYIRDIIADKYNIDAPYYMKINEIKMLNNEIPRSSFHKIKRFHLKELITRKKEKKLKVTEPKILEYRMIKEYFINNFNKFPYPEAHIEIDLNLDSLEKVDLIFYVKNSFGVDITNEIFSTNSKFINFVSYIEKNKKKIDEIEVDWSKILNENIEYKVSKKTSLNLISKVIDKFFSKYFNIEIIGTVPKNGAIIASNHLSMLDWYVIRNALSYNEKINTYCLAKDKLIKSYFSKLLSNNTNIIKFDIDSEKEMKESLQKLSKILKEGNKITIFPEGTRSRDKQLNNFKKSFAILSKENDVPIVPTVIKGSFDLLPPGRWFPKRGKITIKFLEPINPKNKTYDEILKETYSNIKSEYNN